MLYVTITSKYDTSEHNAKSFPELPPVDKTFPELPALKKMLITQESWIFINFSICNNEYIIK